MRSIYTPENKLEVGHSKSTQVFFQLGAIPHLKELQSTLKGSGFILHLPVLHPVYLNTEISEELYITPVSYTHLHTPIISD